MTESNIEALERLCRENLDGLDFQVTMTANRTRKSWSGATEEVAAATEVVVDYAGGREEIQAVVEQHGEAVLEQGEQRQFMDGELETIADLRLTADPHDDWDGSGGAHSSVSGSSSSATDNGVSGSDDGSEPASGDTSSGVTGEGPHQPFPDPSMGLAWVGDTMHVVAATEDEPDHPGFVCDEDTAEAEPAGNIKTQYDDLVGAAADPDLCEWCAKALIGFYNIPEEKVLAREQGEHG